MNRIVKYAAALTVAGACAVATAGPSQARYWHHHHWHSGAAAAAGFAAGALIGAAAANNAYYGSDYYYGRGPAYPPGYYAYDYVPDYGESSSARCTQSPASPNYVPCPGS